MLKRYGSNESRALRRLIAEIKQVDHEVLNKDILGRLEAVTKLVRRSEGETGRFQQDSAFDIVQELNRIAMEIMELTDIIGPANITRQRKS